MNNILITGGAGFIGSNFVRYILQTQPEILIHNLDLLTYAGRLENLADLPDSERHFFYQGDICDQNLVGQILREHKIGLVVHFAAESHVDRSILGPGEFIRTNIQGTFSLLEALREYRQEDLSGQNENLHFHHISTDEVYGTLAEGDPSFTETTLMTPNSPYAASKAASDLLVRSYFKTYALPVTITNCSNNYGPYQFPEKLIPLMIDNAINGKPLPIYGDGGQIRDWLFVDDHCEAIWKVIKEGVPGETYNIGGGNQPTNLELVQEICDVLDELLPDSPYLPHFNLVEHVKDRPGHDRRYAVNIQKINDNLRWAPKTSLKKGLRATISWYLDHQDWVKTIRDKQDYQGWVRDNYQKRDQI